MGDPLRRSTAMTVARLFGEALRNTLARSALCPRPIRLRLLRLGGVTVDRTASIADGCRLGPNLTIGPGSFLNRACLIETSAPVTVGANVDFGFGVVVCTSTHEIGVRTRRAGRVRSMPVVVGDGCWVGAGAVILPGVTLAPGCVIGAGAVVTADTEPDGVYRGVPARRARDLPPAVSGQPQVVDEAGDALVGDA